jgi:hypothetical protein
VAHYGLVAQQMLNGLVIPFLGAGANRLSRPPDEGWSRGAFMPDGRELARVLASAARYPEMADDLQRSAQALAALLGQRVLYREMHEIFDWDYPLNSLHRLLARLPGRLRARHKRLPLIMSTNYDDVLERAFDEAGEAFDLLWYEAKRGTACGKFMHRPPGGPCVPVDVPNEYDAVALDERPVILKLHGHVNRGSADDDSYVVAEDHYIDYLVRSDIAAQIPVTLHEALAESHLLFLGYALRDWNVRVILHRLWEHAPLDVRSWAVTLPLPDERLAEIERRMWGERGQVELLQVALDEYVAALEAELSNAGGPERAP